MRYQDKCTVNGSNTEPDQNANQSNPVTKVVEMEKEVFESQLNDLKEETDDSSQEEICNESGRVQPRNISNGNDLFLCDYRKECTLNMGNTDLDDSSCQADQDDTSCQTVNDGNSCQGDQGGKYYQADQDESYCQADIVVAKDPVNDDNSCQLDQDDSSCQADQDDNSCQAGQDDNSCQTDQVEKSCQADQDEKSCQAYQVENFCQAEVKDIVLAEEQVNDLKTKTENITEEGNLNKSEREDSIRTTIKRNITEEKTTEAKEIIQYKEKKGYKQNGVSDYREKDVTIPGSWKKGDVPSSTLTSLQFTKMDKSKISSQKYPCFIQKSGIRVKLLGYV